MALSRQITTRITDLLKEHPQGLSITDIVKKIDINRNTAGRYLENLLISGQVEMRHFGMAKIYALSDRIPQSAMLSISSDLVMQLDSSLRIVFANDPFLNLLKVTAADLLGKNIEYSAVGPVFDEAFSDFITILKTGISGIEWHGTLALKKGDLIYSCHVTPMVFNDGRKGVSVLLEDLTELRHREIALQESEARLLSIISAAPIGIGVVSDRTILEVNERLSRMTGYSTLELIGKSARMLYPTQEEFEKTGRDKYALIADTGSGTVQTRWKKKDGSIIDILLSSAPINPEDLTRGVTFTALDITERTRAEKALRESEERYRTLTEASNDLIFVIGRDDNVEYVNSFGAASINKSVDEIIGTRRSSHFPAEVAGNQAERLNSVFETGLTSHSDGPIRINGRICWFDHFLMPLKDPDGQVRSVLGVSRDITNRISAEQALRESEERFRMLVEISPDAVILHRDDIIIYVNPAARTLMGASHSDEILGKRILDFIGPGFREVVSNNIRKDLSGEFSPQTELQMLRLDGTTKTVEGRGVRTLIDGKPAVLVTVRDITERKLTEEELFNSRQMLRLVLDTIPVRVFWKDRNSVYLGANKALALDAGFSDVGGIVGKTDYDTASETTADLYRADDREVMESGLSKLNYKEPQIKPDGSRAWLRTSKVPLRNKSGDVIGVLGTYEDITERKMLEDELNASAERYKQLAECSLDALVITDPLGNIITTNKAALTLVELEDHTQVQGWSVFRFIALESRERAQRNLAAMSPGRKPVMQTYTGITARGNRITVEVLGHPIEYKGSPAIIISVRDISKRSSPGKNPGTNG